MPGRFGWAFFRLNNSAKDGNEIKRFLFARWGIRVVLQRSIFNGFTKSIFKRLVFFKVGKIFFCIIPRHGKIMIKIVAAFRFGRAGNFSVKGGGKFKGQFYKRQNIT